MISALVVSSFSVCVCVWDAAFQFSQWTKILRYLCGLQEVLELAFSVLYDPDETLNFVAPNKYEVSSSCVTQHSTLPSCGAGPGCDGGVLACVFLSSTASGQMGCVRCWAGRWGATWRAATWTRSSAWRWSSASSIWRTSPSRKPRRRSPKSRARTTSPTTTAEVCVCVCFNGCFFCFVFFVFFTFFKITFLNMKILLSCVQWALSNSKNGSIQAASVTLDRICFNRLLLLFDALSVSVRLLQPRRKMKT